VIVFDEAQMLPLSYLKPCVGAISELICNYRCTAVLCSATQPALDKFLPSQLARTEICDAPEDLQAFFRRASIEEIGTLDDEALATRLKSYEQVLCIVNTRKQAQNIYRMMEDRDCFHLSTLMTPLQRRWILRKARRRLTDGKPCRLVATSLVEAGVDVDFPVVYRGIAGLDSVIQAMGRCNREGRRGRNESKVYVFMPDPSYSVPSSQTRPIEVFRCVAQKYDDIASLPAIREYFEILYHFEGDGKRDTGLDKKGILKRFDDGANDYNFPFAAVAKDFRLIEDDTRVVLIPLGGGRRVARALRDGVRNRALMRKLGRYSVNIRENHCNTLFGLGIIEQLDEEIYVLCDKCAFDFNTGLALAPQGGQAVFWEG
jgi:CRISPR-associated endonuclease/helicase Cas3